MNLSAVAAEVAAVLDSIPGLRAHEYPPGSASPPCAIVLNPTPGDIRYDGTMGRGMDRMTLPVVLLAGRASERATNRAVRPFLDGSGAQSVKAALEGADYTSLHAITVTIGGVDGVSWYGVDHLAALFELDIVGQGG